MHIHEDTREIFEVGPSVKSNVISLQPLVWNALKIIVAVHSATAGWWWPCSWKLKVKGYYSPKSLTVCNAEMWMLFMGREPEEA